MNQCCWLVGWLVTRFDFSFTGYHYILVHVCMCVHCVYINEMKSKVPIHTHREREYRIKEKTLMCHKHVFFILECLCLYVFHLLENFCFLESC